MNEFIELSDTEELINVSHIVKITESYNASKRSMYDDGMQVEIHLSNRDVVITKMSMYEIKEILRSKKKK